MEEAIGDTKLETTLVDQGRRGEVEEKVKAEDEMHSGELESKEQ